MTKLRGIAVLAVGLLGAAVTAGAAAGGIDPQHNETVVRDVDTTETP